MLLKSCDGLRCDPWLIKELRRAEFSGGHNVAKGVVVDTLVEIQFVTEEMIFNASSTSS